MNNETLNITDIDFKRKATFIIKHNITLDTVFSKDIVSNARKELGYSENTTKDDIRTALRNFIKKYY